VTRLLVALAALAVATPALAAKKPLAAGERIDLNHAPVVELMRLPGVGRSRAEAIAARRSRAPFQRLEDLLAVKGVSRGWLEKQRPHLAVSAPSAAHAEHTASAASASPAAATPQRRP
jgi:competence protein ComEA